MLILWQRPGPLSFEATTQNLAQFWANKCTLFYSDPGWCKVIESYQNPGKHCAKEKGNSFQQLEIEDQYLLKV